MLDRGWIFFLYPIASRPAPIQWVPVALSRGVKRKGREVYHSPPSSAEVKNNGAIPPPPMSSRRGASVIKQTGNFTKFRISLHSFDLRYLHGRSVSNKGHKEVAKV
jgi:hypothetical protein